MASKNAGLELIIATNWKGEWRMCGMCCQWMPLPIYIEHIESAYGQGSIADNVINNCPTEWRAEGKEITS